MPFRQYYCPTEGKTTWESPSALALSLSFSLKTKETNNKQLNYNGFYQNILSTFKFISLVWLLFLTLFLSVKYKMQSFFLIKAMQWSILQPAGLSVWCKAVILSSYHFCYRNTSKRNPWSLFYKLHCFHQEKN